MSKAVDQKRREVFLASIGRGMSRSLAARSAGVGRTTTYEWDEDPEWQARVDAAEIAHIERHLGIIEGAALDGEWQASKWLLSVRHRDDFGTQRIEVTGRDGAPVQIETRPAAAMTDAEIAAELAALESRRPKS